MPVFLIAVLSSNLPFSTHDREQSMLSSETQKKVTGFPCGQERDIGVNHFFSI